MQCAFTSGTSQRERGGRGIKKLHEITQDERCCCCRRCGKVAGSARVIHPSSHTNVFHRGSIPLGHDRYALGSRVTRPPTFHAPISPHLSTASSFALRPLLPFCRSYVIHTSIHRAFPSSIHPSVVKSPHPSPRHPSPPALGSSPCPHLTPDAGRMQPSLQEPFKNVSSD